MSIEYRAYGKTLSTIMTLIKDGHQDVLDMSRELDKKVTDPTACAAGAARNLRRLCVRQKERLSFLSQEVDGFNL